MGLDDKENIVSRFEDAFKNMWVNNGNALRYKITLNNIPVGICTFSVFSVTSSF
jgi:hypothetical protein